MIAKNISTCGIEESQSLGNLYPINLCVYLQDIDQY